MGTYYSAGFNSPWTEESRRRNEIWILKKDPWTRGDVDNWNGWDSHTSLPLIETSDAKTPVIEYDVIQNTIVRLVFGGLSLKNPKNNHFRITN